VEIFHRNLPHYHLPDATYFITFRLAGSLPVEVLARLREEFEHQERALASHLRGSDLQEERYKIQKRFFAQYDKMLDKAQHGPRWLAEARFADLVSDAIQSLHPECYSLHSYCIMCNHVHLLMDQQNIPEPAPIKTGHRYTALSHAMRRLKGRTGYACAKLLGKKGSFWQHESFDHVVRNEKEYERILNYIINNPVKAGLVDEWQNWPYTFVAQ